MCGKFGVTRHYTGSLYMPVYDNPTPILNAEEITSRLVTSPYIPIVSHGITIHSNIPSRHSSYQPRHCPPENITYNNQDWPPAPIMSLVVIIHFPRRSYFLKLRGPRGVMALVGLDVSYKFGLGEIH